MSTGVKNMILYRSKPSEKKPHQSINLDLIDRYSDRKNTQAYAYRFMSYSLASNLSAQVRDISEVTTVS